ncbi:MAG: hypothetical protein FWE09_09815 [Treponema sp.]|nr:hypothetical protein [Treponema sp.]
MRKITGLPGIMAGIALAAFGLQGCAPPLDIQGPTIMVSRIKITGIPLQVIEEEPKASNDSVGWIMVGPAGFRSGHAIGGIAVFNSDARFPTAGIPEIVPDGDGYTATATVEFYDGAYRISMDMANYLIGAGGIPQLPKPVSLEFVMGNGVDISYVDVEFRDEEPGSMPNYMINTKWPRFSEKDVDSSGTLTLRWQDLENSGGALEEEAQGETLAEKLQWIKDNYKMRGVYTVEVTGDEILESVANVASQAYTNLSYDGKPVTVLIVNRGSQRHTLSLGGRGNLFRVGQNVSLEISGNITLQGIDGNNASIVTTAGAATSPPVLGGNFVMNEGVIITGNVSSANGGGVYNSGTFTMNGGAILNNTLTGAASGGGLYNGAAFAMNGGEISGNTAGRHGGGVFNVGPFAMNGGEISGNTANGRNGGGVYTSRVFVMSAGTIAGNRALGEEGDNFGFGGGVFVEAQSATARGDFSMTGGTILGKDSESGANVAKQSGAAAVYVVVSGDLNAISDVESTDLTVTR